jgi:hypothetical protein
MVTTDIAVDPSNRAAFQAWNGEVGDYWDDNDDLYDAGSRGMTQPSLPPRGWRRWIGFLTLGAATARLPAKRPCALPKGQHLASTYRLA